MSSERFPDVVRDGAYCDSEMARAEMRVLAGKHGLAFTFNPGGGEFYKAGWRCQISTYDDVEDLEKLEKALREITENPDL